MIKEPRNRELTREDIFVEYLSREKDKGNMTENFYKKEKEVNEIFKGKKQLELMIKGTVQFDKGYEKLFTFLNKTYNIERIEGEDSELVNILHDLDNFKAFMNGEPVHYFSEIENEYVNYTRVLNAHIFFELT